MNVSLALTPLEMLEAFADGDDEVQEMFTKWLNDRHDRRATYIDKARPFPKQVALSLHEQIRSQAGYLTPLAPCAEFFQQWESIIEQALVAEGSSAMCIAPPLLNVPRAIADARRRRKEWLVSLFPEIITQ